MRNIKIEIKWAFIFMITSLAWMLLERLIGLHDTHINKHHIYTNFFALPAIVIYVLALLEKREKFYNGTMNYKQGLVAGLILTLIITILSPLTQAITSLVITPDYFSNAIKFSVEQGKMTLEEALDYYNLKSYLIQAIMGAAMMGVITSVIVAIFTRKKNAFANRVSVLNHTYRNK